MKLGVSYNLFDGEELLEASIKNIRNHVDHISVVYQTISNFGHPCSPTMEELLNNLVRQKLIDDLIYYPTDLNLRPSRNETKKRQIGLQFAKRKKCSHFMTMDADEFYIGEQFQQAKKQIEEEKIDCSVVQYINYVKSPCYQIAMDPEEPVLVPFIGKLGFFSKIKINAYFPGNVDPTRRFNGKKRIHIFNPETILMHHMWAVRRDLDKKFNSSTMNTKPEKRIKKRRVAIDQWEYGKQFCMATQSPREVKKVENIFGIDIESLA